MSLVQFPPMFQFTIMDTNPHTIAGATSLIGVVNIATTGQGASLTVSAYDSATASGTPIFEATNLAGAGNSQQSLTPGITIKTALTVQASAAPTAPGIMVLYTME